jgi:hypothetical protein
MLNAKKGMVNRRSHSQMQHVRRSCKGKLAPKVDEMGSCSVCAVTPDHRTKDASRLNGEQGFRRTDRDLWKLIPQRKPQEQY